MQNETRSVRFRGGLVGAVAFLAIFAFAASVIRTFNVIDSVVVTDGPVPELSRFDRMGSRFVAIMRGLEPGTAAWHDSEDEIRRFMGKFNRWSGRVIVALSIPLCLSGIWFGIRVPFAGIVEASAIALFGGWFLIALVCGFIAARRREIAKHREWMIRMWGVALGVAMQRVAGTVIFLMTREGPDAWFGPSIWLGFVTTVSVAELWIRATRREAPWAGGRLWHEERTAGSAKSHA